MRAGLFSDREVIKELNKRFVCTTVVIDDAQTRAKSGDELALKLATTWEYPIAMIFLSPDGGVVTKLNSFRDFPGVHPDVSYPQGDAPTSDGRSHADIFLKHVADHFGRE